MKETFPEEKIVEIEQFITKNDVLKGKNLLNTYIENNDSAKCEKFLKNGTHIPDDSNGRTFFIFSFQYTCFL